MIQNRRETELRELKRFRASGGKVAGYTCHTFPAAVAAGLGLWPVRLLCNTSADSVSSGERLVRPDVCPHVKSLLGNARAENVLHSEVDVWIGLCTCDQMRRAMDVLAHELGKGVYPVQVPATRTEASAAYYAGQIARLVSDIESGLGVRYDPEAAASCEQARAEAGSILLEASHSGRVSPLVLHMLFHLFFIARPVGLADFFHDVLGSAAEFSGRKRVVLTGSPLTYEDTGIFELLEDRGIAVLQLTCSGTNAVECSGRPAHENGEVRHLAISAFYRPACIRARPNAEVYERIKNGLQGYSASGLILKTLNFCDLWHTERERMRNAFGVPVLFLDSNYARGVRERLANRIDAFWEML